MNSADDDRSDFVNTTAATMSKAVPRSVTSATRATTLFKAEEGEERRRLWAAIQEEQKTFRGICGRLLTAGELQRYDLDIHAALQSRLAPMLGEACQPFLEAVIECNKARIEINQMLEMYTGKEGNLAPTRFVVGRQPVPTSTTSSVNVGVTNNVRRLRHRHDVALWRRISSAGIALHVNNEKLLALTQPCFEDENTRLTTSFSTNNTSMRPSTRIEIEEPSESTEMLQTATARRTGGVCWLVWTCIGGFATTSTAFGVIWSSVKKDVSGGFTVAAYMFGVGALITSVLMTKHNDTCATRIAGQGPEHAHNP